MKNIILLTGIHGVGKGYISNKIKKHIKIPIYEASKLIKLRGSSSDFNNKVYDVTDNQNKLFNAINVYVKEKLLILDGHTCLLNKNGDIEKIDLQSLCKFHIVGIIYIYDNIENIKKRLFERDKIMYEIDKLKLFQKSEYENALALSQNLNIKLFEFKNGDDINLIINYLMEMRHKYD